MALIKCEDCGKEFSDTTEKCIHCGTEIKNEKDTKEIKKDNNNKNIISFIFSILAGICGFVQLVKMNSSGLVLIYTLLFLATSILLTIYCYPSKKKNGNLLLFALLTLLIGSIARICQEKIGIEYLIRYTLFAISSIMLLYSTYKDKKANNIIPFILLGIVSADSIYNFFALNNTLLKGYIWRLYLIVEALLPIALIFTEYTKDNLNNSIKKIMEKLPNKIVLIGIVLVLSIIFLLLSLDSNNNINLNKNDNNGYNVNELNEEENTKTKIDKTIIDNTTKKVVGEYGNEKLEAEISLDKVYTTDKVLPPTPKQTYYSYYDKKEGKKYLVAVLNVKNTGSKSLNTDDIFSNFLGDSCQLQAIMDGKYEYSGFVVGLEKDNKNKYDLQAYYYLEALEKTQIYLIFEISSEVSQKQAKINACFGDTYLEINNSSN